jgi:hypothetical protein
MGSEVFRFVTVHPPQEAANPQASAAAAVDLGITSTPFIDSLRAMRAAGARLSMIEAATAFVASPEFIGTPDRIDRPYRDFITAVQQLPEATFWPGVGNAFGQIFNSPPANVIRSDAFLYLYARSSNGIVAAMIDSAAPARARGLLVRLARTLWLIRRLAATAPVTQSGYEGAPLVLPSGIFPLPDLVASVRAQRRATAAAARAEAGERGAEHARVTADLAAHRRAVDELLDVLERTGTQPAPEPVAGGARPTYGFALSAAGTAELSESTRTVLRSVGVTDGRVDVARSITQLERHSAELVRGALNGNLAAGTPGPCPPAPPSGGAPDESVTVPTGHGDAKVLGIADLMVLEQELLRYELGEIAHIENVLKSETRSRTFKTSNTIEQTDTTEVETTEEKEQDLSSAERFELHTETQSVIDDSASKQMGLTVHASYGPSVDATANYNSSSSSSHQQSTAASANYAREVTTRAAQRIQTRTLKRRTVRTVSVVEETNEHGFDNKAGNSDVIGVYRYVDKIYRAQVVNYGKRLMLEFVVPEPAAFLRYGMTRHPVDEVSVPKPDRPGYCLDNTFTPLQAEDITRDNYLYWASKYNVQDVTPPPASVMIASGSKKAPDQMDTASNDARISSEVFDLAIPDGYLSQSAFVNIYGETQAGDHYVMVQVQNQQMKYVEPFDDPFVLQLQQAPALPVTLNSLRFYNYEVLVTVLCTLAPERFRAWQLKTFGSVMTAYAEEKSRYDQAIAEARFAARDSAIGGTNPRRNRETEQIELKRSCISQLGGQRFDLFDAVASDVAPYGYPEVDFAEAKAEGVYIQAFEQSFEWNNMTYVFYPYFWGRKAEWPTVAQLSDDDPLFERFLQAGAARVQVPVRLGFEPGVLTYLATGELWSGDGTLVNSEGAAPDPTHVSILDELRAQLGDNSVEGPGRVSVTNNSPNVTGNATMFTAEDEDRRIMIAGKTYVIRTVVDAQTIRLTTNYTGDSVTGLRYSLGGRLVGEPWEVKLPTNLVKLDNSLIIR